MGKNFEEIREELQKRKLELEEKLARMAKERVTDDQVQDPGDQALSSTLELLKTSFQDTELEEYNRLTKALEKIKDGTYGMCMDCGEPISERRLKSFPNASRCLICQEEFEDKSGS